MHINKCKPTSAGLHIATRLATSITTEFNKPPEETDNVTKTCNLTKTCNSHCSVDMFDMCNK